MPLVDCNLDPRQRSPNPRCVRRRGIDHDDLDPPPERIGLLAKPLADTAASAARCKPEQRPGVARCAVDEAGHPRLRTSPGDPVKKPTDRSEPGLVDPQHRRGLGLG